MMSNCMYCTPGLEVILWQSPQCRVILEDNANFTGWCKVAWNQHVSEFSHLSSVEVDMLMNVVKNVELALIHILHPKKINIASLGTAMAQPHLHWHVIPRYEDDSHYPEPIWSNAQRKAREHQLDEAKKELLKREIAKLCEAKQ